MVTGRIEKNFKAYKLRLNFKLLSQAIEHDCLLILIEVNSKFIFLNWLNT